MGKRPDQAVRPTCASGPWCGERVVAGQGRYGSSFRLQPYRTSLQQIIHDAKSVTSGWHVGRMPSVQTRPMHCMFVSLRLCENKCTCVGGMYMYMNVYLTLHAFVHVDVHAAVDVAVYRRCTGRVSLCTCSRGTYSSVPEARNPKPQILSIRLSLNRAILQNPLHPTTLENLNPPPRRLLHSTPLASQLHRGPPDLAKHRFLDLGFGLSTLGLELWVAIYNLSFPMVSGCLTDAGADFISWAPRLWARC